MTQDVEALKPGESAESEDEAIFARIEALLSFRRLDEAAAECGVGIASSPDDSRLWEVLAAIELARDELISAERAATEANRLAPEQRPGLHTLARVYLEQGRAEEARAAAIEYLSDMHEMAEGHLLLGAVEALVASSDLWGLGSVQARSNARYHAFRAVELDADDAQILNSAAIILRDVGSRRDAAELVKRGLTLAPTDLSLQLLHADLFERSDVGATRVFRDVLRESPEASSVVWVLREMIWLRRRYIASWATWSLLATAIPMVYLALLGLCIRNLIDLARIRGSAPRGEFRRSWEAASWLRFSTPLAIICLPWIVWPVLSNGIALGVPLFGLLAAEMGLLFAARADERTFESRFSQSFLKAVAKEQREAAQKGWMRIIVGIVAILGCILALILIGARVNDEMPLWTVASATLGVGLLFAAPPIVALLLARERERNLSIGDGNQLRNTGGADAARLARLIAIVAVTLSLLAAFVTGFSIWSLQN